MKTKLIICNFFLALSLVSIAGSNMLSQPTAVKASATHMVTFDAQGGYFESTGSPFFSCEVEDGNTVDSEGKYPGHVVHDNPDYIFVGWRDEELNLYEGDNAFFVPITRDCIFTAGWEQPAPSLLEIVCDPEEGGYINNVDGFIVPAEADLTFDGSSLTVNTLSDGSHKFNAIANTGYVFDYWEDEDGNTFNEYRFAKVYWSTVRFTCHFRKVEHQHGDWNYSVTGSENESLIATCGKTEECENPPFSITISLKGPGHEVPYTGNPYTVCFDEDESSAWEELFGQLPNINVEAISGPGLTDGKAVEPGEYLFSMICPSNEDIASYRLKIVPPPHVHGTSATKIDSKLPTTNEPGYKECYKCECGSYFEDEMCTRLIGNDADLAAWRNQGGNGYLAILPTPDSGLSGGAIVGIVICSIFLLLLIIFIIAYILWKKKDFKIPLLEKILTPAFRWISKILSKTKLNNVEAKDAEERNMSEEDYLKALKDKTIC